jgi:hypothetical protein
MSYTGTEIFNMAIAAIDELSDTGSVSDSQVKEYRFRAPYLLDMWHRETCELENVANIQKITSLTQTLQTSDKSSIGGTYFLAMHFALADQNSELASLCQGKYEEYKRKARKPLPAKPITDVYGISGGL